MKRLDDSINPIELLFGFKRALLKVGFFYVFITLLFNSTVYSQMTIAKGHFQLINKSALAYIDAPIIITRQQWHNLSGKISLEEVPHLYSENGKDIPSQCDDLNGDGIWDETAFLFSIGENASQVIQYNWVPVSKMPVYEKRTDIHLSVNSFTPGNPCTELKNAVRTRGFKQSTAKPYYQLQGIGFENDKVGFRCFFDELNSFDIFGKRTKQLVLSNIGLGADNWHVLDNWGMDIFKTGNSLGAGGLAIMNYDGTWERLGDADTTYFKVISEGPVRAVFKLDFKGWGTLNSNKINGSETITLWAGKYYYENQIQIEHPKRKIFMASGMANYAADFLGKKNIGKGLIASYTFDKQVPGTNSMLGLAIVVPERNFTGTKNTSATGDGVVSSYLITFATAPTDPLIIRFFAGWEMSDPVFGSQNGFLNYLEGEASNLSSPITIRKLTH